ncbi:hypothetical protein [Marinomonas ostreistagni]|uniref:hypothetical protein n=1 Tax=Marinomonas ostreistagni TaxID=359209 RepID=UPI00194F6C37|nr:hypothetical protein [Marinomonas ostreistagni]MBM6549901.1 hypothetical protein [Marinomonas ostreistagni]
MWNKALSTGLISLALIPHVSSALACDVSTLSLQPIMTQSSYDVFNNSRYAATYSYRVAANLVGEDCALEVILQLEDTSRSLKSVQREALDFEWYSQTGNAVANQWRLTLTDEQPSATVQLRFPGKQWLNAGIYEGELELLLPQAADYPMIDISPSSVPVYMSVPAAAKIHYYGASQHHYDLALGELYSNKVIHSAPNLWVQSNAPYTITLSSAHQGMLRHESNNPKWDIPYQITIDQDAVDLKQIEAYIDRNASTFGQALPMNFTIGNTIEKPGGQYEDTLEISIEPHLSQRPYL